MLAQGLEPVTMWDCRLGEAKAHPDGTPFSTEPPVPPCGLRLLWAAQLKGAGFAYGLATQANRMRRALVAAGVSISYNPHQEHDFAVHFLPLDNFTPVVGKRNLLSSTMEMSEPTAPLSAVPALLVVPCAFNKEVLGRTFSGPIEVCPLGVDTETFAFHERKPPGPEEPFRVLFCGNSEDDTKGAQILKAAWRKWRASGRMPANAQLYIKTTGTRALPLQYRVIENGELKGPFAASPSEPHAALPKAEILDNRNLPLAELVELYRSAHVLVSPSMGEGWNLVLCEAMATGLPCIWPAHTAMLDYGSEEIGFPVVDLEKHVFDKAEPNYYGWAPTVPDIITRLEEAYHAYPEALERGRRASARMQGYTWAAAAEKFIAICRRHLP